MNKETAITNWYDMITKSWTWDRLTQDERTRFNHVVENANDNGVIKGNHQTRWNLLNMLYHSFLMGLGYKPIGWRETEETPLF